MKTLGKYEILEKLGTGGMGTVFRARDTVLERDVAMKTIHTGADVDSELKQRFYREARSCAKLQHPHIVTVYDLGEQEDFAYIVMELLVGSDLRSIIAEKRPMPLETRLELSAQVCEGLAHAHRNGIVHRDIKPGNIFIQQGNWAKILDFGIARVTASQLTRAGAALGTPDYMAPEQIGGKPCETRTYLFAAALVFFEFLVSEHPFKGSNVAKRIVSEQPQSLCAIDTRMPASLEQLMARGLDKSPERRFQTGDEFAGALRAVREELRLKVAELYPQVESLRNEVLASRAELGDFERCPRILALFQEAGADWNAVDQGTPKTPAAATYLELHEILAALERIRGALEKALSLAQTALKGLRHARVMVKKGDLEGSFREIERLKSEFPDHPQIRALGEEVAAAKLLSAPSSEPAAPLATEAGASAGPVRSGPDLLPLLARLQQSIEEQDRATIAECSQQLRVVLTEQAGGSEEALRLRAQAEKALLTADFELARARFAERMQENDVSGAEESLQFMENLPLMDPEKIETRQRYRREFDEVRLDEDPNEQRMADFLRLLHEFDEAVDHQRPAAASQALGRMQELLAADERFAMAVSECEKRLNELVPVAAVPPQDPIMVALRQRARQLLELDCRQCVAFVESLGPRQQKDKEIAAIKQNALAGLERPKPAAPEKPPAAAASRSEPLPSGPFEVPGPAARSAQPAPPPAPPKLPEVPAVPAPAPAPPPAEVKKPAPPPASTAMRTPSPTSPPSTASRGIATLEHVKAPVKRPVPAASPPSLPRMTPPAGRPTAVGTRKAPARAMPSTDGLQPAQKWVVGGFTAGILLLAGVIGYRLIPRSAPVAPALASAEVASAETRIYAAPVPGAKILASLRRGDRLNVLRLPGSRDKQWVEVQYVTPKRALPRGYANTADLGNWSSEEPEAALALLKLSAPGDSAAEPEIRTQLEKLAAFVARFGISPQGPEANLEMARLNLALARMGKGAGRPFSEWQNNLDAAAGQIATARSDPDLAGQADRTRRDWEALREPPAPFSTTAPRGRSLRVEQGMARATEAWKDGRYNEALRTLDQVLRNRPNYTPAIELRQRVHRAKQFEARLPSR
ncbi:MAG: serine/threonine protein kinase [Acidobacteria bacterium]|nr:serine/threonine protein kinase [Acidobacteriota bacterium]